MGEFEKVIQNEGVQPVMGGSRGA